MTCSHWAKAIVSSLALLTVACPSGSDDASGGQGGTGGASEPAWQVVFDEGALDRALLGIWGSSESDVFAVGGPLGNEGFEAMVIHFDGVSWRELAPGGQDTFWWVSGSGSDDVWMVGENGRATHYDGASFTEFATGTTATLWGVMAFAKDDAWAVGGTPEGTAAEEDDVVLHWDGASWSRVTLPGEPRRRSLFKVWGTSSNDLYVVGEYGTIWHKSGEAWTYEADPPVAGGTLFTVHGCGPDEVYAVGDFDVLARKNGVWTKQDVEVGNRVNGVSCASPGKVGLVGFGGLKKRFDGAWTDDFIEAPHGDLHSIWSDPSGAYWAVGGDFLSTVKPNALRNGIVTRYGAGRVSATLTK